MFGFGGVGAMAIEGSAKKKAKVKVEVRCAIRARPKTEMFPFCQTKYSRVLSEAKFRLRGACFHDADERKQAS